MRAGRRFPTESLGNSPCWGDFRREAGVTRPRKQKNGLVKPNLRPAEPHGPRGRGGAPSEKTEWRSTHLGCSIFDASRATTESLRESPSRIARQLLRARTLGARVL